MNELGKLLMIAGIGLVILGAIITTGSGKGWLGRLPGDIHVHQGSFSFHFPLVTCILISVILSLLMWFFRR